MIEYYTMKECFDACGDDDFPYIETCFNANQRQTKSQMMVCCIDIRYAIRNDWQIKRAEPKVLSDEQVFERLRSKRYGCFDFDLFKEQWLDVISSVNKNGQIREWLRPEQVELREAVRGWIKVCSNENLDRIINAYKKLKPPKVD